MKDKFYEVYMSGHRSSTQYYQKFENAYRAWVTMATSATSNEVVEEILMSGIARAKEEVEDSEIFLDFGGCILESMNFDDGEENEE